MFPDDSHYSHAHFVEKVANQDKYFEFFINAMGDMDENIRELAKSAVNSFWTHIKIPRLYSLLINENPRIRQGAREALASMINEVGGEEDYKYYEFKEFLKYLIEAAAQEDDDIRKQIASEIRIVSQPYFSDIFVEELKSNQNEWIREFSVEMLRYQTYDSEEEYDEAIGVLIKALKDPSPRVRRIAAETMGNFYEHLDPKDWPEPEKIPYIDSLIDTLGDANQSVREEAINALGKLGVKPSSIGTLVKALISSIKAKSKKDLEPIELFINMLKKEEYYIRRLAILSLGYLGDVAVVETLKTALNDRDWRIREATILALGSFPSEYVLETLKTALNDPEDRVQSAAEITILKKKGESL